MSVGRKSFINKTDVATINKTRKCGDKFHSYSRLKKSAAETGFKKWSCVYCGNVIESS